MDQDEKRTSVGPLVPRRAMLRGGLAGLAAAFMSRTLTGCDETPLMEDGGPMPVDAGPPDAGTSGLFPLRNIAPPPPLRSQIATIGTLSGTPDANDILLPPGFTSRVIGRSGQNVA